MSESSERFHLANALVWVAMLSQIPPVMVAQESGTGWSSLIFPLHAALLIMVGSIRLYAPPRPNWVKRLYQAGFFGNFLVQGGWAILLLYNGIAVGLLALLVSILSLVGFFTFRAWPEFPVRRRLG